MPAAAPSGFARSCSADDVHAGAAAVGADDGVVLDGGEVGAIGLGLGDGVAEPVGDGEVVVDDDATGAFDPPEQPASVTTASTAQTGPMVRTRRA